MIENKLTDDIQLKLTEQQKTLYERLVGFVKELDARYFQSITIFSRENRNKSVCVAFRLCPSEDKRIFIELYLDVDRVVIDLGGWHEDFYYSKRDILDSFRILKEFLIFLLSSKCKLIIFFFNGKPYKWHLFGLDSNGQWRRYSTTGLIFFNYFGRKHQQEQTSTLYSDAPSPREFFESLNR